MADRCGRHPAHAGKLCAGVARAPEPSSGAWGYDEQHDLTPSGNLDVGALAQRNAGKLARRVGDRAWPMVGGVADWLAGMWARFGSRRRHVREAVSPDGAAGDMRSRTRRRSRRQTVFAGVTAVFLVISCLTLCGVL